MDQNFTSFPINKKKKGFLLKTTFSHFDYYFVIISLISLFYTLKLSILRNNSEIIMMAFYNAIIVTFSSQLFCAFMTK
jgi:hypothetical protein